MLFPPTPIKTWIGIEALLWARYCRADAHDDGRRSKEEGKIRKEEGEKKGEKRGVGGHSSQCNGLLANSGKWEQIPENGHAIARRV